MFRFYTATSFFVSVLSLPVMANAQTAPTPPTIDLVVDRNGVDLIQGTLNVDLPRLSIGGSAEQPVLTQANFISGLGTRDVNAVTITPGQVNIGKRGMPFPTTNPSTPTTYDSIKGTGERLTAFPAGFTFQDRDGSITNFQRRGANYSYYPAADAVAPEAIATSQVKPSGEVINYYYRTFSQPMSGWTLYVTRLQSVTSTFGYMLKYEYVSDVVSGNFSQIQKVSAINMAVDYCNPTADHCTGLTKAWPSISYGGLVSGPAGKYFETITDPVGETARMTWNASGNGELSAVKQPGSTTDNILTTVSSLTGFLATVTRDGVTYGYDFGITTGATCTTVPSISLTCPVTSTNPAGGATVAQAKGWWSLTYSGTTLESLRDELGRTTTFGYDSLLRPTRVTSPEGNYVNYTYDARGNVTEKREVAKPGSGLADRVTTAQYAASCGSPLTCNKPTSVIDPNGNVTAYAYDGSHGGIITETRPAVGGVAPVIRYSYVQRYAWVKNASGVYVQAASPVWLPTEQRTCKSTATVGNACAGGAADELVQTYDYGPNNGPNNLLLRGMVVTTDGASMRTCYGYDHLGRKISETSPRAGLTSCP